MKKTLLVATIAVAVGLVTAGAKAEVIDLNFDTLQDNESVDNYYNGGNGSLGSGPGPNYGITFSDALVLNEYSNNEANLISPPNSITFLTGTGAVMNAATGFTTGFSFNYSAPIYAVTVTVWSGLDGTGTLLASITLPLTSNGSGDPTCGGKNYCPDYAAGVTFSGTAMSVNFSGTANYVVYDDITLGAATPGPSDVPEPASLALLGTGLLGFGWIKRRRA